MKEFRISRLLNIGDSVIENTEEEELLGIVIDKKRTFDEHISKLCHTKVSFLWITAPGSFSCSVWMSHSRHLNYQINRKLENALRIKHNDYQSTFNIMEENDCSVNINIKYLETRILINITYSLT